MTPLSTPTPWSRASKGYARWLHHHLSHYAHDALAALGPRPTDRVLDVGCGAGAATLAFAREAAHVTAVDFSPGMLQALNHALRSTDTTNVTVLEGDGQALVLPDGHADLAVSMFSLIFFPDRHAGLTELYRCLRPGGRVAISCWPPMVDSPAMRWMVEGFSAGFPESPPPERAPTDLDSAEGLREELAAAGFVDLEVQPICHEVVVTDVASFWADMCDGSAPLSMLRDHFTDDDWAARHAAAVAHLQEKTPSQLVLPMPALLGLGTRPAT